MKNHYLRNLGLKPLLTVGLIVLTATMFSNCKRVGDEHMERLLDDWICAECHSVIDTLNHKIIINEYDIPKGEREESACFKTFEFSDASLTFCFYKIRQGGYPVYVILNTQDSLFILSDKMTLEYYRWLEADITRLRNCVNKYRFSLPEAILTPNGIDKSMRDSVWSLGFEKEYRADGIYLKKSLSPFSYKVDFELPEKSNLTEEGSRKMERKRLPPFLFHNMKEFSDYFVHPRYRHKFVYEPVTDVREIIKVN